MAASVTRRKLDHLPGELHQAPGVVKALVEELVELHAKLVSLLPLS